MMPHDDSSMDRVKRTLENEFSRMEDDFDDTREKRSVVISKLMNIVSKINDENGKLEGSIEDGLKTMTVALKAISDVERAASNAINLKLKNREQEIASNSAAKDRIAVLIQATRPGSIEFEFPEEDLEKHLDEMFSNDIKDSEMKSDPNDIKE